MDYQAFNYPMQLNLHHRPCLVVGGGSVAERKVLTLLKAGARVTLIAVGATPRLQQLSLSGDCTLLQRAFIPGDTAGYFLIIAATGSEAVNRAIAEEAAAADRLINVVDRPDLGNFTVPGQLDLGSLLLTVYSSGNPLVTRLLLADLKNRYGAELADFITYLTQQRALIKTMLPTPAERTLFWRTHLTQKQLELVLTGHQAEVKESINNAINSYRSKS